MQAALHLDHQDSTALDSTTRCSEAPRTEADRPTLTLIEGGVGFRAQLESVAPLLFPRALQLTRHPERAHDLVQDTLLRALRFESTFTPGSNLRAWLAQVMYSVFISQCRRRGRERALMSSLSGDPCFWTEPTTPPTMCDLSPGMQACLAELPEDFVRVLLLVDVAELPYKDAAECLGVPVGTVMSRLHRARRSLRAKLEGEAA